MKTNIITYLLTNNAVCRRAPATLGLLNIEMDLLICDGKLVFSSATAGNPSNNNNINKILTLSSHDTAFEYLSIYDKDINDYIHVKVIFLNQWM